ncbi:MAG: 2-oxo acid dehydrogenase subunit E2 [Pseudomonadota bacterium]
MSKTIDITVPDIGDFADVEVIEILIVEGERVEIEAAILTLESDKATMEIPAPASGTIDSISIAVGDRVSEGTVIGTLTVEANDSDDPTPSAESSEGEENDFVPSPDSGSSSDVQPELSNTSAVDSKISSPREMDAHSPPESLPPVIKDNSGSSPHASPGIRRFARELGADLFQISGSGAKGRILKGDVKEWVKSRLQSPAPAASSAAGIPEIPAIDFSQFGDIETIALGRIKRLSGPHLQRSWLNIPHVTHHDQADITQLEEFRRSLKEEASGKNIRVTLLSFVIKAMVHSLKAFPSFNASLAPDGESLILKGYFNIGIAVDTDQGLVVPVIRGADQKSIFDLSIELSELSQRARDGKLQISDLQGGCMSISSLGGIGGTGFTPIVNAPEVAILGLSRSSHVPILIDGNFEPRLMLPMSLSYDHRVIDGAEAARFCVYLSKLLGDIRRVLL